MEAQSQHGPKSKMSRKERKRALEEVREQGVRHRAEVEAKAAAAERPPSTPRSPSVGRPVPRPVPGWAADHMAAAMPLTAAAMPSVDGARVMPTDPEGLRRMRKAFEADIAAATGRAAQNTSKARAAAASRQRSLNRMMAEQERANKKAAEARRMSRSAARNVYDLVGFDLMFRNGMSQVEPGLWSETLEFSDMCYQSARDDEQRGVFDQLQTVANLFSSDASFQYLLTNIPLPEEEIGRRRFFDETAAGSNAGLARLFNEV